MIRTGNINESLNSFIISNKIGLRSLEKLRADILASFEADDKRRGVPYLKATPQVSSDYLIKYTEKVQLHDDEIVTEGTLDASLFGGMFGAPGSGSVAVESNDTEPHPEPVSEPAETSHDDDDAVASFVSSISSAKDPLLSSVESFAARFADEPELPSRSVLQGEVSTYGTSSDGYDIWHVDTEPTPAPVSSAEYDVWADEHADTSSADNTENAPSVGVVDPTVDPVPVAEPAPVSKPTSVAEPDSSTSRFADVSESMEELINAPKPAVVKKSKPRPSTISVPPSARVPSTPKVSYKSLRDLIKSNPGCTIEFASRHFSKREIQKELKMGKIFLRAGKLSV